MVLEMITVGIDVGAITIKAAVAEEGEIRHTSVNLISLSDSDRIHATVVSALSKGQLNVADVNSFVFTGIRKIKMPFDCERVTEILCNASGVHSIDPSIRTIIDIGAENARVISCGSNGKPLDFEVNSKCASGTGVFLDTIAKALEIRIADIGPLALRSDEEAIITSTCSVFAESEVVGLIARGVEKASIARGVLRAIVSRLYSQVNRVGIREPIALIGGGGLNDGLQHFLQEDLGCPVTVLQDPQVIGAIGAAIIAFERHSR